MQQRWRLPHVILVVLAGWTLFGALTTVQVYHLRLSTGVVPSTWGHAFSIAAFDASAWAVIHLLVVACVRIYAIERHAWGRTVALFLAMGIAVVLMRSVAESIYAQFTEALRPRSVGWLFVAYFPTHILLFIALVGATYGVRYFLQLRQREIHLAQNAALLTKAQLSALKMQLQPHFLFNTLNAITALLRQDPMRAERMIEHLGSLLRTSLAYGDVQQVTLAKELELLAPYLAIEKERFGERLRVEEQVDPDTLDAQVPHLILQPLVENALRHGIAGRPGPGTIAIHAARDGDMLVLEVKDDGMTLPADWAPPEKGVGITNVRSRLRQLYPDRHEFRISSRARGGVTALVRLKLERSTERRTGDHVHVARNHSR
jgi:two-component system, LytTR family, sensor kinase